MFLLNPILLLWTCWWFSRRNWKFVYCKQPQRRRKKTGCKIWSTIEELDCNRKFGYNHVPGSFTV